MANTFDWIEIHTHDIEQTAKFYESVFGWKMIEQDSADGTPVWIFDTGAEPRLQNLRRGGIWAKPKDEPVDVMVYILVDEIEPVLTQVVALGGEVVTPKTPQGSCFRACFAGPDGISWALWQENKI